MGNRIGWILLGTGVGLALAGLFALPWYTGMITPPGQTTTADNASCAALAGTGCVVSDGNTRLILVLTVAALVLALVRRVRPRWATLCSVGVGMAAIGIGYAMLTEDPDTFFWPPPDLHTSPPLLGFGSWSIATGLLVAGGSALFLAGASVVWLFADGEPGRKAVAGTSEPRVLAAWAGLVGSGVALAGSFMPWQISAAVPPGALSPANQSPARIASFLSVGAILLTLAYIRRDRRAWAGTLLLAATVLACMGAQQLAEITRVAATSGLYVFLAGSLAAGLSAAALLALEFAPASPLRAAGLGSALALLACVVLIAGPAHSGSSAGQSGVCQGGAVYGHSAGGGVSGCLGALYENK